MSLTSKWRETLSSTSSQSLEAFQYFKGSSLIEVAGYREGGSVRSEHMQYPDYAGEVPVEARYPVAVAAMSDDPNRSGRCA